MLAVHCISFNIALLTVIAHASERIVGGKSVKIVDFPYQLSLRYNDNHICGAVLVSPDIALSAAHCFKEQGSYSVNAGIDILDNDGQTAYIKRAILHPGHNQANGDNDIAILKFLAKINISRKVKPIQLADSGVELQPGVEGIVSGWGSRAYGSNMEASRDLRAVQVPVLPRSVCESDYKFINFSKKMFCAGVKGGGKDACNGDSGGPFVVNDTLYGLVAFGIDCAKSEYPGVYTSISAQRQYIKDNCGL